MIDSYCYLDHEPMYSDLKNVIKDQKDNGVSKILSICTTNESFSRIIKIDFDPIIFGTFEFIHMRHQKMLLQKMK